MGLHTADVIEGYELACQKALELLELTTIDDVKNCQDPKELSKAVKAAICSKQVSSYIASCSMSVVLNHHD
jgi:T-complex protein 1 subunit theta